MKFGLKTLISAIVILLAFVSIGFVFLAGVNVYKGLIVAFTPAAMAKLHSGAGVYFLQAIDLCFIAVVGVILTIGMTSLFGLVSEKKLAILPKWLLVQEFHHLKILVWNSIILAMVVYFFIEMSEANGHYTWEDLLSPISILLLSISVYFVKK